MRLSILAIFFGLGLYAADADIQTLIDNGHWKRARAAAESAYQKNPNDARTVFFLARVRHEFGQFDEAVKLAEAAIKLDPKVSAYHRELGEACADGAGKVSFLKQLGYARHIHSEFDTALALAPKDVENLMDQVHFFLEAPGIAGGDKKKAVEFAAEVAKVDPAQGYLAQAYIARKEKQNEKLEELYKKAAEANPKNVEAHLSLIGLYLGGQSPNPSAAEPHIRAVVDLKPDRVEGHRLLAYVLTLQKRYDDAAKVVTRAETAIPDDLSPYVYAARAMIRNGEELPKAESYLQKYLSQTKEPEISAPKLEQVHVSLASLREKQGHKPEAVAELEAALRINPNFEPAKREMKRLK